jgi:hypothetical protein
MEQYDSAESEVWATPAVYIEFRPIEWATLGGGIQRAVLTFDVHLVTDSMLDGDKRVVDTLAVNHFAAHDGVFRALQGFRCNLSYLPAFSALTGAADWVLIESVVRTASHVLHRQGNLLVSVQTFAATVKDYAAVPNFITVVAIPVVTAEIEDVI